VLGAYAGAGDDCYEICANLVTGALLGEMAGAALGAHVGNGLRGSLPLTLLASAGTMGVGILGARGSDAIFWAAAVGQIALVTVVQVRTSPEVDVSPVIRAGPGGVGVGLSLGW
jgi:hypothetical protein